MWLRKYEVGWNVNKNILLSTSFLKNFLFKRHILPINKCWVKFYHLSSLMLLASRGDWPMAPSSVRWEIRYISNSKSLGASLYFFTQNDLLWILDFSFWETLELKKKKKPPNKAKTHINILVWQLECWRIDLHMLFKSGPRIKLKHTQACRYFSGTWCVHLMKWNDRGR